EKCRPKNDTLFLLGDRHRPLFWDNMCSATACLASGGDDRGIGVGRVGPAGGGGGGSPGGPGGGGVTVLFATAVSVKQWERFREHIENTFKRVAAVVPRRDIVVLQTMNVWELHDLTNKDAAASAKQIEAYEKFVAEVWVPIVQQYAGLGIWMGMHYRDMHKVPERYTSTQSNNLLRRLNDAAARALEAGRLRLLEQQQQLLAEIGGKMDGSTGSGDDDEEEGTGDDDDGSDGKGEESSDQTNQTDETAETDRATVETARSPQNLPFQLAFIENYDAASPGDEFDTLDGTHPSFAVEARKARHVIDAVARHDRWWARREEEEP
ncbi:unnamed protein product, partial [Phaeothamnion confervicola]